MAMPICWQANIVTFGIIIGTFAISFLPQYIEEYAATGKRIIDITERYDMEEPSYELR